MMESIFVHAGMMTEILRITNLSGDKYQRNYSLLKHLKGEQAITDEEADLLKKKFDNRESGVVLLGKQKPYYLGYCPIERTTPFLVCIVAKGVH